MTDVTTIHQPVLLRDCVDLVAPALAKPGSIAVDCTLGLAGHSTAFLKASPNARLIGIDRDTEALALATKRMEMEGLADRFTPVHAAFDDFSQVLSDQGVDKVNAVFMDLGLSSLQIDETERGFSYSHDAPLDMRMDVTQPLTAEQVLAEYSFADLVRIFRTYGEERFSKQIAREIVRRRETEPLTTSGQLNRLVDEVVPQAHRPAGNPAKRVFQALRIEVNGELDKLAGTLPQIANHLAVGGRLVVESYHSLEDKTVKAFMNQGTDPRRHQGGRGGNRQQSTIGVRQIACGGIDQTDSRTMAQTVRPMRGLRKHDQTRKKGLKWRHQERSLRMRLRPAAKARPRPSAPRVPNCTSLKGPESKATASVTASNNSSHGRGPAARRCCTWSSPRCSLAYACWAH